jgi:hypothetical protein
VSDQVIAQLAVVAEAGVTHADPFGGPNHAGSRADCDFCREREET